MDAVSVLRGNGDGTLQTATAFAAGDGPTSLIVADVDHDALPDVVTANRTGDDVSVLLGNGDGSFQSPLSFPVGDSPLDVAVADVDGDTNPDLIAADWLSNGVSVLLGNGDGSFQSAAAYRTLGSPAAVAAVDLDGDGFVDVVTGNSGGDHVAVLLNQSRAACDDGVDNDEDGRVDWPDDPQCASADERSEHRACSNGLDDDGDGNVDHPDDPGCFSVSNDLEQTQCQDGINNDPGQDARIDYDGGQSIHGTCSGGVCPPGVSDTNSDGVADPDPNCLGKPWQDREHNLKPCGLGAELVFAVPALSWLMKRRRRNEIGR
jgi:hypothetical protein